jgi:chromosome segregation ATPase
VQQEIYDRVDRYAELSQTEKNKVHYQTFTATVAGGLFGARISPRMGPVTAPIAGLTMFAYLTRKQEHESSGFSLYKLPCSPSTQTTFKNIQQLKQPPRLDDQPLQGSADHKFFLKKEEEDEQKLIRKPSTFDKKFNFHDTPFLSLIHSMNHTRTNTSSKTTHHCDLVYSILKASLKKFPIRGLTLGLDVSVAYRFPTITAEVEIQSLLTSKKQKDLEDQEDQIVKIATQLVQLQPQLSEKEQNHEKSKLNWENQKNLLKKRIQYVESQNNQLLNKTENLEDRLENITKQFNQLQPQLSETKQNHEKSKLNWKNKKNFLKNKIQDLESRNNQLTTEAQKLKKQPQNPSLQNLNTIEKLEDQIENITKQFNQLQQKLVKTEQNSKKLEQDWDEERMNLDKKLAEQAIKIAHSKIPKQTLAENTSKATVSEREKTVSLPTDFKAMATELNKTKECLQELQADHKKLNEKHQSVLKEQKTFENANQSKQVEINSLKEQIESQQEEWDKLLAKVRELTKKLLKTDTEQKKKILETKQECAKEFESTIQSLKEDIRALLKINEVLLAQLNEEKELREQIKQIVCSFFKKFYNNWFNQYGSNSPIFTTSAKSLPQIVNIYFLTSLNQFTGQGREQIVSSQKLLRILQ